MNSNTKVLVLVAIALVAGVLAGLGFSFLNQPQQTGSAFASNDFYVSPVFKTGCFAVQVQNSSTLVWYKATTTANTVLGTTVKPLGC